MTTTSIPVSGVRTGPLTLRTATLLQVLPGVPMLFAYLLFARTLEQPVLALYLALLMGEVPTSWAIMFYRTRREHGRVTMDALFPWRKARPAWQYLALGLPLAVLSLVIMGLLLPTVAEPIREAVFGWVPPWAVMDPVGGLAGSSRGELVAIGVLALIGATLVGGVTQELYARGFLLPRIAHAGAVAPVANAAAFAMLHLVSPWSWPVFFLVSLPWAVAVYRTRSVQVGIAGHVGMLLVMWLGTLAQIAQRWG